MPLTGSGSENVCSCHPAEPPVKPGLVDSEAFALHPVLSPEVGQAPHSQ